MKVGVVLPTYRRLASAENISRAAEMCERLGFDSVWVTDHIVIPANSASSFGSIFFEAVSVMAFLAGVTERVEIGAAILIVPYRHPLLLAKMLATIDQLSGGRLIVGAGLGWLEAESRLMGIPHRLRARIAEESLVLMRRCWEEDRPRFQGKFFDVADFDFSPRPYRGRRLPILIGGASIAALKRVARYGDGWIGDSLTFEELEASLARLRIELQQVGRNIQEVQVAVRTGLQVVPETASVTASPSETGWKTGEFASAGRAPFRGVRQDVIADFRRAAALGVHHLLFEFPVSRGEESMDLFELLAGLRAEAGA